MQIWTGDAARSELLISEPKTRVRPQAVASAHRAHPVSSSRDQQPETGSSLHLNQSIHVKSTVHAHTLTSKRLRALLGFRYSINVQPCKKATPLFCAKRGVNQMSLIAPGMLPARS